MGFFTRLFRRPLAIREDMEAVCRMESKCSQDGHIHPTQFENLTASEIGKLDGRPFVWFKIHSQRKSTPQPSLPKSPTFPQLMRFLRQQISHLLYRVRKHFVVRQTMCED